METAQPVNCHSAIPGATPSLDVSAFRLVMFMTEGMSLGAWERLGMFEREVALYRALRSHLRGIAIVSYGGNAEQAYAERLPGIDILCNRWNLPVALYTRFLPLLHAAAFRKADVFKTNQMRGAVPAMSAARTWGKPLVARCGYLWSEFVARGADRQHRLDKVESIERKVLAFSSRVVVTTTVMKNVIISKYGLNAGQIDVIPNYVLTEMFSPGTTNERTGGVCFVGRLEYQKNTLELLKAFCGLEVPLVIIGDGSRRGEMESFARQHELDVDFVGNIAHGELVAHLRRASVFVLTSLFEGHPKTLIEAMACGVSVIGADSPGIREVIRHGETGWVCGTDAASIRSALQTLLADRGLRERLGSNARAYAVENFSLEGVVRLEQDVIAEAIRQGNRG